MNHAHSPRENRVPVALHGFPGVNCPWQPSVRDWILDSRKSKQLIIARFFRTLRNVNAFALTVPATSVSPSRCTVFQVRSGVSARGLNPAWRPIVEGLGSRNVFVGWTVSPSRCTAFQVWRPSVDGLDSEFGKVSIGWILDLKLSVGLDTEERSQSSQQPCPRRAARLSRCKFEFIRHTSI